MQDVAIYTHRGPVSIFIVLMKGAAVALGVVLILRNFGRLESMETLWLGVLLVCGGAVFGGYDLVKLLDRSPQLILSEAGFCDRRKTAPVVIPWSAIKALGYRGGSQSSGWSLELFLHDGGMVAVPASHLNVKPRELVRLVQDFAPGAEVDQRFRLWIG
ncbi:hypothetical protein DMC47_04415 [Nostoc sp. 3335mG]|nr:hypothetical protein DMC47_04415 [Nostoc sp. 3335mG]